ncbi:hypothetical protein B0H34DRAFT_652178, partial [Crassisporium funariophilum]
TPPKSWRPTSQEDVQDTAAWRANALSLVAKHMDNFVDDTRVPSLALLCLKTLLSRCASNVEFREDVVPFIPPHLRRDVIRYCAVHSPLSEWKLEALFYPDGHADGEMIIVGPKASLRDDHFLRGSQHNDESHRNPRLPQKNWDWESDHIESIPLQYLVLLSTRLPTSTFLTIPPTLTHIALVNLSTPILHLHRLPKLCPLLILLDLSYNYWLEEGDSESIRSLDRVEWLRWSHLKVVGLRGLCNRENMLQKINQGRWDDVEIVQ